MTRQIPELPDSPPDDPEIPDRILDLAEKELLKEKIDELTTAFAAGDYADEINTKATEMMIDMQESAAESKAEARAEDRRRRDGEGGP
jgi:hypothetical protein